MIDIEHNAICLSSTQIELSSSFCSFLNIQVIGYILKCVHCSFTKYIIYCTYAVVSKTMNQVTLTSSLRIVATYYTLPIK